MLTIPSGILFGQEQTLALTLLPPNMLMPKLTANATEHGISLAKILSMDHYWAGIGGIVPIVGFKYDNVTGDITVASTVYTQLDHIPYHIRVINTDFYVDVDLSLTWNNTTIIQLGPGHTSQHLNDDAFEILGYSHSINYVRDYVRMFVVQKTDFIRGFVYAGTYYHYKFKVPISGNHIWLFEFGADALNYRLNEFISAYTAIDIKLRDELQYGSTQSYQLGIKINGASRSIIRIAYNYRTGYEERGQFFNQKANIHSVGVYFDF